MVERRIPRNAIKIPMGDVQQKDDYSCGAAAWMAVSKLYGVGPDNLEEVKAMLGTGPEHGTYFLDLLRCFAQVGLDASVRTEMRRQELEELLDKQVPCLLSIQAWAADQSVYDDPDHNQDGHYVVAIGYDSDGYFYFMDPSTPGRHVYLHWSELDKRWHENEGMGTVEVYRHLAIVVRPRGHHLQYQNTAVRIE